MGSHDGGGGGLVIVAPVPAELESFRGLVAERMGLFFEDDKMDFLADVLRKRMEHTGCQRFSSYCERICASDEREEIGALAEQLTVGETCFVRYAERFRAFAETVLPSRIKVRGGQCKLRILCAGCASGEEPYSVAILLRERFPHLASWDIRILGVDISPSALQKASRSRYPQWSLRETPDDLRSKFFLPVGRDFQLHESIRSAVVFERRNLAEEDLAFWRRESFDVVFWRNVMMYLTADVTRRVVARIAQSLAPGGFLFLGHAETLRGISQEFHLCHTHDTFYYQDRREEEGWSAIRRPLSASLGPVCAPPSFPELVGPHDTWYSAIRRASERIATLTGERPGASAATTESTMHRAPRSESPRPQKPWERAQALELLRNVFSRLRREGNYRAKSD
jgi:chemotaxis protein methyltransferase CheR